MTLAGAPLCSYTSAMPKTYEGLADRLTPESMIDLRSDARTRRVIFVVRMIAVVFFVPLFAGIPLTFRHASGFDPALLWSLGLGERSGIVSFLVLAVIAEAGALVHEGIRAGVVRFWGNGSVTFAFDGVAPRISAPDTVLSRKVAIAVSAAPFLIVSTVGLVALLIVPDRIVPWVFLPTVIHNVIGASDFVVVAWLVGIDGTSPVRLLSDGWVAYGFDGKSAASRKKK